MTGSKKKTDASSILGAARRAQDVPRPQSAESHNHTSVELQLGETVTPQVRETVTTPPEKRVNVGLRASTHKALKLQAVQQGRSVQDLVEEMAQAYLAEQH